MQAEDGEGKQNKEIGGGEHASPEKGGGMGMRECKSEFISELSLICVLFPLFLSYLFSNRNLQISCGHLLILIADTKQPFLHKTLLF